MAVAEEGKAVESYSKPLFHFCLVAQRVEWDSQKAEILFMPLTLISHTTLASTTFVPLFPHFLIDKTTPLTHGTIISAQQGTCLFN